MDYNKKAKWLRGFALTLAAIGLACLCVSIFWSGGHSWFLGAGLLCSAASNWILFACSRNKPK